MNTLYDTNNLYGRCNTNVKQHSTITNKRNKSILCQKEDVCNNPKNWCIGWVYAFAACNEEVMITVEFYNSTVS